MRSVLARFSVAVIAAVAMLALVSDQGARAPVPRRTSSAVPAAAEDVLSRWPEKPRALARLMVETYGAPDELVASQVSWSGRSPWRRIVVFRDPDPAGRRDHLLETVAYGAAPMDHHWRDLAAFGRGASYDPATGELSARTDSQETNYLALNLADEVLRGRRSARDAQDFYDAASNLSTAGKSSPYMQGLLFGARAR